MAFAVAGCARANAPAATGDAAATDTPAAHADAAAKTDAAVLPVDAAGCAISTGMTPALDGAGDLAKYPAAQQVTPGAMLGSDGVAIAWDPAKLYVTVTSSAFTSAYEPVHIYVEAAQGLGVAQASMGKEYSGLIAQLPFTPTHLIAVRRVTDAGTGPYDGVYVPASGWSTRATPLAPGSDVFVSTDMQTVSAEVPWSALGGCPHALRLAVHVVHAQTGNEWKDLVPSTHTPWQAPGGGYYEIDLTGSPAVAGWTLR